MISKNEFETIIELEDRLPKYLNNFLQKIIENVIIILLL